MYIKYTTVNNYNQLLIKKKVKTKVDNSRQLQKNIISSRQLESSSKLTTVADSNQLWFQKSRSTLISNSRQLDSTLISKNPSRHQSTSRINFDFSNSVSSRQLGMKLILFAILVAAIPGSEANPVCQQLSCRTRLYVGTLRVYRAFGIRCPRSEINQDCHYGIRYPSEN